MATEVIGVPYPLHEWTVIMTGQAMRERFRIESCAVCGGPEVFSKIAPRSRCFRCGARREHLGVKQHKVSWRRCALCGQQNMAGIPLNRRYCHGCGALTAGERAKRLRWKRERESTPESPNEIKGESE